MKALTAKQLLNFRGINLGNKIYISIKGEVFDVSSSYHLYGPEGPYHAFAGKEIARSLALFSLEEEDIGSAEMDDLDEEDHKSLEEWTVKFRKRYKKVAELKEPRLRLSRVIPMASIAISALAIAVLMARAK